MKLFAAAMIRNDGDIIAPFLQQCAALFDTLLVADIQSTDGTGAALRRFADPRIEVRTYSVHRQEKYQGALMGCLSREAFANGADWVFFLDTDEFIDVPNRAELERYLREIGSDVLLLPWINLVPSQYGDFTHFDPSQPFYWSGRTSKFTKLALSSIFAANNPDYCIEEGNHTVSPAPGADPVGERPGIPLLHVPIRSQDRFRFKISVAHRMNTAKHNRQEEEGTHVREFEKLLSAGSVEPAELNAMAANYGETVTSKRALDPPALGWPVKRLPAYIAGSEAGALPWSWRFASLSETLVADADTIWDRSKFPQGAKVDAVIEDAQIRIIPQPVRGDGRLHHGRFPALGGANVATRPPAELLIDVVSNAGMRVNAYLPSAWLELIPVMYALFTVLRPRRFVELGVHGGASFFAACQASRQLGLSTECIAVDSWIGDEHAGLHDTAVFDAFQAYLGRTYPDQHYIQAYFSAACNCFEDGSIDLLHIDGFHTYEAVRDDFQTWLPRMSESGVVIFHDINVFERDFGVWRLWEELTAIYPAFGFLHKHGLGIIFVGREPHPYADLLRKLAENRYYGKLAQSFFAVLGTLAIENCSNFAALEQAASQNRDEQSKCLALQEQLAVQEARFRTQEQFLAAREAQLSALRAQFDAVIHSTSWRASAPLRAVLGGSPKLAQLARRSAQLSWWTLTGQLPRRLRERRPSPE
jgi:hypothetical protein